jgi:hypothetical protein
MAYADYRLCDVCEEKTFYDANLDYDRDNGPHGLVRLGDWKVLCIECAKTHEIIVKPRASLGKEGVR